MNGEIERVVITGGAGFIGSHLSEHLVNRGFEVAIVDDLRKGRREYVPDSATLYERDISSDDVSSVLLEFSPDVIIHLAAVHFVPYCNEHPEETFQVNVVGTRNLLRVSEKLDTLRRFIFASSAAIYPVSDEPNPEDRNPGPTDIYGRTKLIGEDLTELFHLRTGCRAISARLFNVYGPNETNPHLIPEICEQVVAGESPLELGNLTPRRDYVHVTDVVQALTLMLTEPTDGYDVFNVGTGDEFAVEEVAQMVIENSDRDMPVTQRSDRVRGSDRVSLLADISHIKGVLSWEPTIKLEDGLATLLEHYQEVSY